MARPRTQFAPTVPWINDSSLPPTRDAQSRPLVRVHTLGAAVVQCGEVCIGPTAGVLFALLIRITHAPGMRLHRDVLLDLLWPEQTDTRRRASLRQSLYKLRGYGVRVEMRAEDVSLDMTQVTRSFAVERTAEQFERDVTYGNEPFGQFLPNYRAQWSQMNEWVASERELVHAEVRQVLVTLLRSHRERADWSGAQSLARWLLLFDPLHEDATLTLAECAMLTGAKAEAIAILDRYLAELGPNAGEIRLPASQLRKRFADAGRGRVSFAPTERHFVGRETEIAELTLALRRARWHEGNAILFHAPPGMGKTRLTWEVGKVAAIEGLRELRASCRESDACRPFSVFFEVLPEVMTMQGAIGCSPESLAVLHRLMPDTKPTSSSGSSQSEPGQIGDSVEFVEQKSESIRDVNRAVAPADDAAPLPVMMREPLPMASAIRAAIVDVFTAVSSERPLWLVVDDTHWIDSASWETMVDLIDQLRAMRLMVLMTSREPHARPQRPQRIPSALLVRELEPLSVGSVSTLARLIGEDLLAPVGDILCDWFANACEGNALFLRSLVNHWIDTGEAGGVPPTLAQAIEHRLARLSADATRALQAAAMLGGSATVPLVQRTLQFGTMEVVDALEELTHAGAFRSDVGGYSLHVHDLLAQAAIQKLGRPGRITLHRAVADALLECGDVQNGATAVAVVRHLRDSGSHKDLLAFVLDRGAHFLEHGLPSITIAMCEAVADVLQSCTADSDVANAFDRMHMEAMYVAGRHSELLSMTASKTVNFSIDLSWDAINPSDVLDSLEAAKDSDVFTDYEDLCARTVMLAEAEGVPLHFRYRAAISAIKIAGNGLNPDFPTRAYAAGVALCPEFEIPMGRREKLDMYFHTAFGDVEIAASAARRILSDWVPRCTPSEGMPLMGDVAYALRAAGFIDEARILFERAFETACEQSLTRRAGVAAWYLSMIAMDMGNKTDVAERWILRAENLPGAKSEELLLAVCAQQKSRIALALAQPVEARKHAEASKKFWAFAQYPKRKASELALDLGIAVAEGHKRDVDRILPEAISRFSTLQGTLGQDFLASRIVLALKMLSRSDEAEELLSSYIHGARREKYPAPAFLLNSL